MNLLLMVCIRFAGAEAGAHFGPHYLALTGTDFWLLTFLDFNHLVRGEAMRFAVDCDGCFFAWGFDEAKDFAGAQVVPVFRIFHSILGLSLKVFRMGVGNSLSCQSIHMLVNT